MSTVMLYLSSIDGYNFFLLVLRYTVWELVLGAGREKWVIDTILKNVAKFCTNRGKMSENEILLG